MDDLLQRVGRNIAERHLLSRGARILVAVSGGLDSMVLLHVLHALAPAQQWHLAVAHLNHRLRGTSSAADERLVLRVARRLGLRTVVERADVRQVSRRLKISIEMAARKVRHEFLARAASRLHIESVALAHHADDQVELFFLRLFRGTGGEGLSGMQWRSPSPVNKSTELVRPLLGETKEALRRFATDNKVRFREDASNASLEILRNRIRHELLPLLTRRYQPAIGATLKRLSEIAGAESDFANATAAAWLASARQARRQKPAGKRKLQQVDPAAFARLHVAVQRRCVLLQLLEMGITPDFELVERLRISPERLVAIARTGAMDSSPATVVRAPGVSKPLAEMLSIFRTTAGLLQRVAAPPPRFQSDSVRLDLGLQPGSVEIGHLRLRWRWQKGGSMKIPKTLKPRELFDADKVGRDIILRHWTPGDRFQPIGMDHSVKLQDFFTNRKVPREVRRNLVLATTAGGEVFWVEGMRISERFKLTKSTIRRLLWLWERL